MKTEPSVFSIEDLETRGSEPWDGVRNYQARNYLRDDMKDGDQVLFYHSNCDVPGVVGIAKILGEAQSDPTQFEKGHVHYDPSSKVENPRWWLRVVAFVERFPSCVSLEQMRAQDSLAELLILRKGNRLSVTPVSLQEFRSIVKLGRRGI